MKIRIDLDQTLSETEIVIHANQMEDALAIQKALNDSLLKERKYMFYKNDREYYLPLDDILFFETEAKTVYAHLERDAYITPLRLYELEEQLPAYFIRISKSTILNTRKIYSITRSLTTSSLVEFKNTHKQVYVSRNYYKLLKLKLEERRLDI